MVRIQKPELLAPLNNWKTFESQPSVLDNADAFYFGLQTNFSMRARAGNFSIEDLDRLVSKIHNVKKKCYLATNILIYNTELVELHQTIQLAKDAGVDALICHDMATVMIAKQIRIPFHISTQANISNKISAKFYESLGAERLILARELDLEDVKEIIENISIPAETFVHGAMCTAISGRCYLSAELMNFNPESSANRGKCVQPCRRFYTFQGEEGEKIDFEPISGMFFNVKDLCMIGHIPELIEAGISSFKVEGRMRDPLYTAKTIACYRDAINSYYDNSFSQEKVDNWLGILSTVFNRGFHTGFYFSKPQLDDIERTVRGNVSKYHRKLVGKVINYYRKAQAIEIELYNGQLLRGQELIIENSTGFYYNFIIESMQIDAQSIEKTTYADDSNHIIVGIKVEKQVPINSNVYLFKTKEN